MSFTKDQLLARLQELKIEYSKYEHPAALTVEDQAKYVGDKEGALSKNLFLKDKKQRFYIVSALTNTKVDLKVLSQRLGLGKGGLRMAPEEALGEILKVPLGCVTPFAVVNESARQVSLLLDQGFKSQNCCFFHPLSNDISISLSACDLDKFLKSIGRVPSYVDLEANPSVGKDQPPDLASLVPSGSVVLPNAPEQSVSAQSHKENNVHTNSKPTSVPAKTVQPSTNAEDGKNGLANSARTSADVGLFVQEILDKTSALVLSGVTDEAIKEHGEQLGTVLSNSIKKQLSAELKHLTTLFKNTAYTEGFYAGTRREQRHL